MTRFVIRRLLAMLFVMFAVSVLAFIIFNVIPNGDPAARIAGKQATPQTIEAIRVEFGFDKSLPQQYLKMMEQLFTGDLQSYSTRENVIERIRTGFPRTLALTIGGGILWLVAGVALGMLSALRAGRFSDRFLTVLALVGLSMPVFWVGALVNHYLGYKAGIFPNGGYVEFAESPTQWLYHLIMPWCVISLVFIGVYSRVLRSNVLDTLGNDYVRTARAKGLSERSVLTRHVLRNSLIPIVTLWGLDIGLTLGGGAILTETVFDLDGVGQYFAEAIGQLDVPPVLGVTVYGAFFIVFLNALVDIAYAALDPRIRFD
jgi:peptide/nickel transport system permease protein